MDNRFMFAMPFMIFAIPFIAGMLVLSSNSCKNNKKAKLNEELIEYQTNLINELEDSLKDTINHYEDSLFVLNAKCDSLSALNDSIMERYMVNAYKIERIDYYTKIVDKDNSQMVFYKGWIKRVLR